MVVLKRYQYPDRKLSPSTWEPHMGGGHQSAWIACPTCGQLATLGDHTIADNGKVTPSLVCPYDGCDFHDYVELEGWDGTIMEAE